MDLGDGLRLNQLVASGIAHRAPPKGWARFLGALTSLGENPRPGHPIWMERVPGRRFRYLAERNYLRLQGLSGEWRSRWDLESSGKTEPLPF